ncbi:hypothetical protein HDU98_007186 [Podochytrium sp. JEL0797]|nr:hypothetical protein HDU98_007186 [Podochytrium sp. JEL0797]
MAKNDQEHAFARTIPMGERDETLRQLALQPVGLVPTKELLLRILDTDFRDGALFATASDLDFIKTMAKNEQEHALVRAIAMSIYALGLSISAEPVRDRKMMQTGYKAYEMFQALTPEQLEEPYWSYRKRFVFIMEPAPIKDCVSKKSGWFEPL